MSLFAIAVMLVAAPPLAVCPKTVDPTTTIPAKAKLHWLATPEKLDLWHAVLSRGEPDSTHFAEGTFSDDEEDRLDTKGKLVRKFWELDHEDTGASLICVYATNPDDAMVIAKGKRVAILALPLPPKGGECVIGWSKKAGRNPVAIAECRAQK